MECPKCGCDTFVIETRNKGRAVRRRRKCQRCGFRFTTFEISREYYKEIIGGVPGEEHQH